jgi:hypothetical protein
MFIYRDALQADPDVLRLFGALQLGTRRSGVASPEPTVHRPLRPATSANSGNNRRTETVVSREVNVLQEEGSRERPTTRHQPATLPAAPEGKYLTALSSHNVYI